jgi:iron complex outermembrane receptor protein
MVARDDVNYGSSDQAGGSINLSYDLGAATLRSITGLTSTDDQFGFDLAGGGTGTFPLPSPGLETGNNGLLIASDASMNSWSEELQLLGSAFDKRLDWLFGLFYLNEDGHQKYSGHWTVAGPFAIGDFTETSQSDTDSYAVFAEGTWHFTDRFSVVAGVRYTDTEKNLDSVCTGTTCVPAPDGSNAVHLDDSFDETTFKVGANYQLSDATLLYLSFAQGFQAGGYQTLCLGNMSCAGLVYDSETVDSIEAGVKTELFDRRLRLNAASFYAMYDKMQQTEQRFGAFPQANVGDIDVYGIELEANWTPSDALSIFGHLGWQDSGDYDHLAPTAQAKQDYDLPSNPKLQGKVGFLYTMGVSDLVEFFYGADLFYTDDYYTTSDNSLQVDSYTRLNGQVGFGAPDQKWQLVLAGRNITDEEDVVSGIYVPGFTNIRTVLPPSEFMLTFKYRY